MSTLLTIADMAGQAIERTGLSEAEHRLVTTLQDSVLVPLPDAPDLDIAACYLPAVPGHRHGRRLVRGHRRSTSTATR